MYQAWCGGEHLCHDLRDLPKIVRGERFDGVIGGIPCQSFTKLRAMRAPKFADLTQAAVDVLDACQWDWFLFENVSKLAIPVAVHLRLNACNFGIPHQSRPRWFTHSANLAAPTPLYSGTPDDLKAYSVVAGRIYGPKRGAWLQGWPEFADLPFRCSELQEALADGVPRCLADAWIRSIETMYVAQAAVDASRTQRDPATGRTEQRPNHGHGNYGEAADCKTCNPGKQAAADGDRKDGG